MEGSITASSDDDLPFEAVATAERIVANLTRAARTGHIKAIVLRVNSGGGDIMASEYIWRAIYSVNRIKPVIVSMGDVAASGAYYLATAAQAIVAEPSTVTGSIGIYLLLPDISGLLDMLGVEVETIARGRYAALLDPNHVRTDDELALLKRNLDALYRRFLQRVAQGRSLPLKTVEQLAQGRVYTGARAKELKLVDHLGGLQDAVALAGRTAGLGENPQLVHIGSSPGMIQQLGSMMSARGQTPLLGSLLQGHSAEVVKTAVLFGRRPAMLCPFLMDIE